MASTSRPPNRGHSALSQAAKRRLYGENNINAGNLRELPWIAIDKFFGDTLKATVFILTHCHTDHMVGLDEAGFWNRLQDPCVKFYLSEITPNLIPLFGRYLGGKDGIRKLIEDHKLIPLPVCSSSPIELQEPASGRVVKLTLLPAGHCPGSVMLQFEYDEECILYTGDCRISASDLKKIKSLHCWSSARSRSDVRRRELKTMSHLYIDTTFCSSRSQHFPGRIEAMTKLVDTVRTWLKKRPDNCVNLCFSARFSHEFVLTKFHEEFGVQSHVSQDRFDAYQQIPAIAKATTLNPNTKFHLCEKNSACLINAIGSCGSLLTVRLSSMWFMRNRDGSGPEEAFKYERRGTGHFVTFCYSMHSSLDEISEMIDFLQPKVVTPLVLPKYMNRTQLEVELRESARGDYIYEDYVDGLGSPTVLKMMNGPAAVAEVVREERESDRLPACSGGPLPKKSKVVWDYRWSPSPPPVERRRAFGI